MLLTSPSPPPPPWVLRPTDGDSPGSLWPRLSPCAGSRDRPPFFSARVLCSVLSVLCCHGDFPASYLGPSAAAPKPLAPAHKLAEVLGCCSSGFPVPPASGFSLVLLVPSTLLPPFAHETCLSLMGQRLPSSLSSFIAHPFSSPFSTDWGYLGGSPETLVCPLERRLVKRWPYG